MKEFLAPVLIHIYSAVLEIVRRLALPLLKGITSRRGWNVAERQKLPYALRDHRNRIVVWTHAASLSEAELLLRFLEIIHRRHPDDLFLVTAATRSGVDYLERHRTFSMCAIGFLPFDTLPLMRNLIDRFNITRVWLMETELWPCMLWTCVTRRIPVGIVNARIEESSFASYRRFRSVFNRLFSAFDLVFAQDTTYAGRFLDLGVRSDCLHIVGNIKGHVSIKRPLRDEWARLRKSMNLGEDNFVLTAGDIHPGEGVVIRRCLDLLSSMDQRCKCIIVPHSPNDVDALIEEIGKGAVHLDDTVTGSPWEVCVIDKVGVLDEMYKLADVALVGGTYVNVGGHNVWDAAQFGIPVFFGPDYHAQTEHCEKLMTAGVGFMAGNAEDLARLIFKVVRSSARKFINAQVLFMETVNKQQSVLEPFIP